MATQPQGSEPDRARAADAAALASEPVWSGLVDHVEAVFSVDRLDGTPVWVSPRVESVTGCSATRWLGSAEARSKAVHDDDRGRVVASARRAARSQLAHGDEFRLVLPGGAVRWMHSRSLVLPSIDDGDLAVYGVLVDVTRSRSGDDVSEQVGRLFRVLIEHTREAVTIVDGQGVVVYHNPSMGRVIDRPAEWFEGRTPLDLMPAEDAARAREVLMRLAGQPGAQLPGEFRLRHRDGSLRPVEGVATNLLHDPAVRGIVLNYRDVTEQRAQEQRLRDVEQRRQSLLEEIINAEAGQRSRIAEELHDDTIQVMTAAMLELDRSERHLERGDVDAARSAITGARQALSAATDRTRRLTFELRPQLLEAAGLSAAVRDLAVALRRDTGAEVRVRSRLGRYPIDIETLAYRTVREALINVRKHARATHVDVRMRERQGSVEVRVRDDGRGFRSGRRQGRATSHIGLETARERVRSMGGSFELTSVPGEGTTVEFSLPLPGA